MEGSYAAKPYPRIIRSGERDGRNQTICKYSCRKSGKEKEGVIAAKEVNGEVEDLLCEFEEKKGELDILLNECENLKKELHFRKLCYTMDRQKKVRPTAVPRKGF